MQYETEKIFRLCSEFANKNRGKIAVSYDKNNISKAASYEAMSAIAFSKNQCIDFGAQPVFVTRRAVVTYNANGAVHLSLTETGELTVTFIDSSGIDSSFLGGKAKIGQIEEGGFKETVSMRSYKYYYEQKIIEQCRNMSLGYKVLINAKNSEIQEILISLLSDLGCTYSLHSKIIKKQSDLKEFAKSTKEKNCDCGIFVNFSGSKYVITDSSENIIQDEYLDVLRALVMFKSHRGEAYVARIAAPEAIDVLAKKYGAKVVRDGVGDGQTMRAIKKYAKSDVQLKLEFDAAGGFIEILDCMKSFSVSMSKLVSEIPPVFVKRTAQNMDFFLTRRV